MKRTSLFLLIFLAFFQLSIVVDSAEINKPSSPGLSLWDTVHLLSTKRFVDLTHAFKPEIPHWKGYPKEKIKTLYTYKKNGFWAEQYRIVGEWGTHVDPPAHFVEGLRTLDEIPVKEMIAPLVLFNVSASCKQNPDYVLSVQDIKEWEGRNGPVPEKSFAVMRTDWSKKWPVMEIMQNKDDRGTMHYPGWSVEALQFLIKERNIVAIGHETTDADPGVLVSEDKYPAQTYLHGENRYQAELLTNLDQLPEAGSIAVIAFPKPKRGSGFPARVFAILP